MPPIDLYFAPLQGYTEAFYRNAHAAVIGGIREYMTPFLRLEKGQLRPRDRRDVENPDNDRQCTVPQLLVNCRPDADFLASYLHDLGYSRLDLNFGCPFPPVLKHGLGAAILTCPDAMRDVLAITASHPSLRVSVKMRLCEPSVMDLLNDYPLEHIIIHPRTAEQQYGGEPSIPAWEALAARSRHPVIFNGSPFPPNPVALACGRPFLMNPLLPLELNGIQPPQNALLLFHRKLVEGCIQTFEQPLLKLKTIWDYLLPNAPHRLRKAIAKSKSVAEYVPLAEEAIQAQEQN